MCEAVVLRPGSTFWSHVRSYGEVNLDMGARLDLAAVSVPVPRPTRPRDPPRDPYLADWTATKLRWKLSADDKERAALETLAKDCSDTAVKYEVAP
ncbi:hypothetical protein [Streptomyces sp. NPDC002215]|uniref:hypothetical protein n=1 Tax=Streptomyces sp. NPDC002215 TaxID=3154412 RepID=UPI00331A3DBF